MSLRVRLILLIVALVGFVAVALSALHLNSLVNSLAAAAIERSQLASQQVSSFLIDHINQQSEDYGAPTTLDETKSLWYGIISSDREISNMLERSMANSTSIVDIVEINVAGETGQILASSNPDRVGSTLTRFQDFGQWKSKRPVKINVKSAFNFARSTVLAPKAITLTLIAIPFVLIGGFLIAERLGVENRVRHRLSPWQETYNS